MNTQTETTTKLQPMPYWTPSGIVMADPPPAYAAVTNDEMETQSHKLLGKHGYELNGTIGGEFSLIDVTIWQHKDGHLRCGRPQTSSSCIRNHREEKRLQRGGSRASLLTVGSTRKASVPKPAIPELRERRLRRNLVRAASKGKQPDRR